MTSRHYIQVVTPVALSLFCMSAFASNDQEIEQKPLNGEIYKIEAQQKVKQFGQALKQTLVSTIKEKGYHAAVEVCKTEAPSIADELSRDGWSIGRTSLKVRNASNVPDEWEASVLTDFDARFKAGDSPDTLTASTKTQVQYRFMKAIPTAQVCLACHGEQVDASLLDTIQSNYPNDNATGFTLNDIRGAFTLTKELEN